MDKQKSSERTIARLLIAIVGMFAFGFAMVPLYDAICDVTGLNGKTGGKYVANEHTEVKKDRLVSVQFLTNNNGSMPWEFRPVKRVVRVHPGEINSVSFYARNPAGREMTAQAIPSVSPGYAAQYLHKTECFCFAQQRLAGGESVDMPLQFVIDSEIPDDITTLTLSYTLFDVSKNVENELASR